jgi:hypothetical protein
MFEFDDFQTPRAAGRGRADDGDEDENDDEEEEEEEQEEDAKGASGKVRAIPTITPKNNAMTNPSAATDAVQPQAEIIHCR